MFLKTVERKSMRIITHKVYYSGLCILFLAMLLSVSDFSSPRKAHAQEVTAARATIQSHTQVAASIALQAQGWNGKVIVVSLSQQWLVAVQDGEEVFDSPVLTGRPALPTPTGTYHIFAKLSPTTFHSSFPHSSPFWYPPTHINYAMEWKAGGYYLHDSWWHTAYGPGTNGHHYDPTYGWQEGSHGCVSMSIDAAAWLYHWAPIGTTVRIMR